MIARERHLRRLEGLLKDHPVVAILGARQVGKTTLAQVLMARAPRPATRFDLEDPDETWRAWRSPSSPSAISVAWWSSMRSNAAPTFSPSSVSSPTAPASPPVS